MRDIGVLNTDRRFLVERELPLVNWTINRYIGCNENILGLSYEDLHQEGCIALCRAAALYHADSGAFSTFAVTVIRNHLLDYCRKITADNRNLPMVSLESLDEDRNARYIEEIKEPAAEEDTIVRLGVTQFLQSRRNRYAGSARLGVEALELRVLEGYGVTEIARLYNRKPNEVGAWISRAVKKIRKDITENELYMLGLRSA